MILIYLFTTLLYAQTEMGQFIDDTQDKYASKAQKRTVIFDRDELGWQFAYRGAFDSEEEQAEIIKEYLWESYALEITDLEASYFPLYISAMTSSASALPLTTWCAVFPPSANTNIRLGHERIMQLTNQDIYEKNIFGKLRKRLSGEELKRISLYHEVGHCLDTKYINQIGPSGAHSIHLAESFAESMAILMMDLEGFSDVAKKRAHHRAVYSKKMSRFFIDNPHLGMGSPSFLYGGQIYYLSPVIMATRDFVRKNETSNFEMDDLIKEAQDIVDNNAIPSRSFIAIHLAYKNGNDETLAAYKEKSKDWPEMFEGAYSDLKTYLKEAKRYLGRSFGIFSWYKSGEELLPFDLAPFCHFFSDGNKQSFFNELDIYRKNLERVSQENELQSTRANKLDSIYQIVSENCVEAS